MDRNVTLTLERILMGHPIICRFTCLDSGCHVLLTGGVCTHVGAISTCRPGQDPETRFFPGHKDQFISEPWAKALAEKTGATACVVCGIHYDHAAREEIDLILTTANQLLADLLAQL